MKDIIRNNIIEYDIHLNNRDKNNSINTQLIKELDQQHKESIQKENEIRHFIKKNSTGEESKEITITYKNKLKEHLISHKKIQEELSTKISFLPNILNYATPIGKDEEDNQIIQIDKTCVKTEFNNNLIKDIQNHELYIETLQLIQQYEHKPYITSAISSNWINNLTISIEDRFINMFANSTYTIEIIDQKISIQKLIEEYNQLYNYFIYQQANTIGNNIKSLFALKFPNINEYLLKPNIPKSLSHDEIGKKMHILHMETGATITGTRFALMSDQLSELSRAIGYFLLDLQKTNHFREIKIPSVASNKSFYNAGKLPKFADQSFKINDNQRLISTGEIILANIINNTCIDDKKLPIRYCTLSPCFRSEAGSLGRDTKGIIRLHEFDKVELFTYCNKNDEQRELQYILKCASKALDLLNIKYRVVILCSGDVGNDSAQTYDIEAWLPSQQRFLEISSCSSVGYYQTCRSNAKYQFNKNKNFLVTLNGSGLAITRLLAIIIETYYNPEENSITIPEALQKYMNNQNKILPQPTLF
ncbi:MAG: serine--tRNA ligase [Pseudomonadota bacterium]